MTADEKQVIFKLRESIEYDKKHRLETIYDKEQIEFRNNIELMLNLVEKQAKEIEELNKQYDQLTQYFVKNHVAKDKIKGKIKEYNKEIKTYEDKMLEITQREKHYAIENKDYIKYSCIISNFTDKIKLLKNLIEEE